MYHFGQICLLTVEAGGFLVLFGQEIPATPATILGAFILVAVGSFTLIGWIVRRQFENQDKLLARLDTLATAIIERNRVADAQVKNVQENHAALEKMSVLLHELLAQLRVRPCMAQTEEDQK